MAKRLFSILLFLLAIATRGLCQQISYIEETKNWYYVYDEQGKRIGGLSRSSVGELKQNKTKNANVFFILLLIICVSRCF